MEKTWTKPEVVTLDFAKTENGGMPSRDFDQQWFDENGALHVNFTDNSGNNGNDDKENKLS